MTRGGYQLIDFSKYPIGVSKTSDEPAFFPNTDEETTEIINKELADKFKTDKPIILQNVKIIQSYNEGEVIIKNVLVKSVLYLKYQYLDVVVPTISSFDYDQFIIHIHDDRISIEL